MPRAAAPLWDWDAHPLLGTEVDTVASGHSWPPRLAKVAGTRHPGTRIPFEWPSPCSTPPHGKSRVRLRRPCAAPISVAAWPSRGGHPLVVVVAVQNPTTRRLRRPRAVPILKPHSSRCLGKLWPTLAPCRPQRGPTTGPHRPGAARGRFINGAAARTPRPEGRATRRRQNLANRRRRRLWARSRKRGPALDRAQPARRGSLPPRTGEPGRATGSAGRFRRSRDGQVLDAPAAPAAQRVSVPAERAASGGHETARFLTRRSALRMVAADPASMSLPLPGRAGAAASGRVYRVTRGAGRSRSGPAEQQTRNIGPKQGGETLTQA